MMMTMRYVLFVCVLFVWCSCVRAAEEGNTDTGDCVPPETEKCKGSKMPKASKGDRGAQGTSQLAASHTDRVESEPDNSVAECDGKLDKMDCVKPPSSVVPAPCPEKESQPCPQPQIVDTSSHGSETDGSCVGGATHPCERKLPPVHKGVDDNIDTPTLPKEEGCTPPEDATGKRPACKPAGLPLGTKGQKQSPGASGGTERANLNLQKQEVIHKDGSKILQPTEKTIDNTGHETLPSGPGQSLQGDKKIAEKQQGDVGGSSNGPKDAHRPGGTRNDAPASGPTPPAVNTPEAESAADDHPEGEPVESAAQAAVEQSDAVQSQTSPTSTSTSATEATSSSQPNSSPSTDKGQDTKAVDSSGGAVWVHAPPLLLLALFAVTAVS
ncbi:hypothetical protein DQ04_04521000 [Trypanosoma grayi]|uniref:hypothetical protein n=1 Tax=Trypanosoma grayi TaxID=71804 RepID=UPI0004F4B001|nr:hypothetical protein DQ04_04521000 [Trypanosoma grayi]KEG09859.1 hypothetical protein DQ04_04521000 [Trypanosoma grayi]